MKIGILTWHKELNHGAVLQAYASQCILSELGVKSVMLDYIANEDNMDQTFSKKASRLLKKLNIQALKTRYKLKKWNNDKANAFENFRKSKCNLGNMYNVEKGLDKVLIGSDMVFDFYEGYNPFMYGKDVKSDYIFSYAACFGYATKTLLDNYSNKDEIIYYIKKLKAVAYRDDNTGEILREVCGIQNPVKTIDPVLLYGFREEQKKWNEHNWKTRRYVLIYSYTYNMDSKNEVEKIKEFAKVRNLEIISVGYLHLWCDECVNADPKEFVELFANAEFVFTDTFHGTIFSLTFSKQFLVLIRNNAFKIKDIMSSLGLEKYLQGSIDDKIEFLKSNPLNYKNINKKIDELRMVSKGYINQQIES